MAADNVGRALAAPVSEIDYIISVFD